MSRYKLTIKYDGTLFYGWQIQPSLRTVQGELEQALKHIMKSAERIPIYGSGRTDSGVHAIGQVAHFDLITRLEEQDLKSALNSYLSEDCRITSIQKVKCNFHARFNALKRSYLYQCYKGESILYRNQAWCLDKLNVKRLNKLALLIIGTHDFASFCKNRGNYIDNYCTVFNAEWKKKGDFINFFILGNRFLHHMVRYLVGTMIKFTKQSLPHEGFKSLLINPEKDAKVQKAPPQGLFLDKVFYAE